MAKATVPRTTDVGNLSVLLDSPEIGVLIADLDATRWTGRPGYPIRTMVGMALVKSLYCLPTWTRTVRLVAEHDGLQRVLGAIPSIDSCYRFTRKLRKHDALLQACLAAVVGSVAVSMPGFGETVAIDGSDLPAYANGQRFLSKGGRERTRYSDPDASWGHRSAISTRKGGGFYGYKIDAAVCTTTGLPIAWNVRTARAHKSSTAVALLDATIAHGFTPETAALDKGYDIGPIYDACTIRGIRPIVPLRQTPAVKAGRDKPPECEHGTWTFAGSDTKRDASKWRCPSGECQPASRWVKADRLHPLIPRESKRYKGLYHQRGAVEREFGRLKHEWALLPLRVRRIERVRLHADLSILGPDLLGAGYDVRP
jgi:Transposase DDE domain/Transposase domain (DUF772)